MAQETIKIEHEIAELERQLKEKKESLGSVEQKESVSEDQEKQILKDIVGEKMRQHAPQYQPLPKSPPDDQQTPPEVKEKVQQLVDMVFNKSLDEGLKEAMKTNDPAIIDSFHDALVDELYPVLLERKKIEPVK